LKSGDDLGQQVTGKGVLLKLWSIGYPLV